MYVDITLPGRYTRTDTEHLFELTGADMLHIAGLLEHAGEQNEPLRLRIGEGLLEFTPWIRDELLWLNHTTVQILLSPLTTRGLVDCWRRLINETPQRFDRLVLDRFFNDPELLHPETKIDRVTFRQTDGSPSGDAYRFGIDDILVGVRSRDDFAYFVSALGQDRDRYPAEWECRDYNGTLAHFLRSIARAAEIVPTDAEPLDHEGSETKEAPWKELADLLIAAKHYE